MYEPSALAKAVVRPQRGLINRSDRLIWYCFKRNSGCPGALVDGIGTYVPVILEKKGSSQHSISW